MIIYLYKSIMQKDQPKKQIRELYKKRINTLDMTEVEESDRTIRVTKQTFTYDDENKLTDARVERLL